MAVNPTYPGVYIQEVPSGVRTITGVATSITAFVGRALRGPVNEPRRISNYGDYARIFGGLWRLSSMSYAVQHYFLNGGSDAIIVRVVNGADTADAELETEDDEETWTLLASSPGAWGNRLRITVDYATRDPEDGNLFNLRVEEINPDDMELEDEEDKEVVREEYLTNLSVAAADPRHYAAVIAQQSTLIDLPNDGHAYETRPNEAEAVYLGGADDATEGSDGGDIGRAQATAAGLEANKRGIYALEQTDLFNLMCIPPLVPGTNNVSGVWSDAVAYCERKRALLLVDPPLGGRLFNDAALGGLTGLADDLRHPNAALFYPTLMMADPLRDGRLGEFVPCGAIAGVFARTDGARGVWKAPAGIEANLRGVTSLSVRLSDADNGRINPLGINGLRTFPVIGTVAWGSRTLHGADILASQWKYIPVRRLALMIEESLYRGSQWVVFEPNDEPLWAQIRMNLGSFMHVLYRQGAFQGSSPKDAYFVKCDKETTPQEDIDRGIVNILVGFAPLKPAEFVIIHIQQMTRQAAA